MMSSTSTSDSSDGHLSHADTMKVGKPLNPYAASFIPQCRQGIGDERKDVIISGSEKDEDKTDPCKQVADCDGEASKIILDGDSKCRMEAMKAQPGEAEGALNYKDSFQAGRDICVSEDMEHQNPSEVGGLNSIEDFEMDLVYLGSLFPGLSEQTHADVYFANDGDLDAAIEMLNQLEMDNLDIGDSSSLGNPAETSMKGLTIGPGDASGSSGLQDSASGVDQP